MDFHGRREGAFALKIDIGLRDKANHYKSGFITFSL